MLVLGRRWSMLYRSRLSTSVEGTSEVTLSLRYLVIVGRKKGPLTV